VPKNSERFTATVEGSRPLFKKKSTLLFALEKAAAHVEKQGILLFAFRKNSNHCTILLFALEKQVCFIRKLW